MNSRRGFLSALAGAMVLDPEKLLWRPGAKTISIPKQMKWIRVPIDEEVGGAYAAFDSDGGDLGTGSLIRVTYDIFKVSLDDPRPAIPQYIADSLAKWPSELTRFRR